MSVPPPPPPTIKKGAPPPPAMMKGKGETTKKKWATVQAEQTLSKWSLDNNWNFSPQNLSSIDCKNINSVIEWKDVKGVCEAEEGGSGGVFFIEFNNNKAAVIKASLTVASDTFASRLATRLGIQTPTTKLFYYLKSEEWDPMVLKLWELEQTNSVAGRGSKFAKCLNRPFLMLTEYIPGYHLANLPKELSSSILSPSVLFEIGQLISFDLLLNQWDRFPCGNVWDNEGNPKNIIISPQNNNSNYIIKAIDNNMTSIDPATHAANFTTYQNKVRATISGIVNSTADSPCSLVDPTRKFILQHTGYDIGDRGQIQIQDGIKHGAKLISELDDSEFQNLKDSVEKQVRETLALLGVEDEHIGLSRINVSFLENIRKVFVESQNTKG